MDTNNRSLLTSLLLSLTLIAACSENQNEEADRLAIPNSYQKYEENGVSFAHPESWSISYDSSPSIYTSRGIGLDISEFSTTTVLISDDKELELDYVTDRLLSEFQVQEKDSIQNFSRSSASIGVFPIEVATWSDQFLGETRYELTVARVQSEPHDVFVVFSLSDEDIGENEGHKEHFLKSIRIQ